MKQSFKIILLVVSAYLLVGCSEKELDNGGNKQPAVPKNGVVSLTISDNALVTKTGTIGAEVSKPNVVADLSEESGIGGLVLEESETIIGDAQEVTKGTPVYTENFADVYSAGFKAPAVFDKDSKEAMPSLAPAIFYKNQGNNRWSHDYSGVTLPAKALFFFHAPAALPEYIGTPGYSATDGSTTFSLVPAKYPLTATAQSDVLFSYEEIATSEINSIKFYHAFASVKFKLGNTDGTVQITKVEMSNMLTSGTCKMSFNEASKSDQNAVWTQDTPSYATFSQQYDGTVSYDESEGYFAASFYKDATDESNLNLNGDKKATTTFNCVPRSFSSSDTKHVVVKISYKVGDATKISEVDFSSALNGKEWKAGHLYTYTLKVTDLDVTVEDTATGNEKTDVVITNIGNTSGYIRAAIVANWVMDKDGEEVVVKKCDLSNEGEMTDFGSDWIEGSDNYYYYKYGVDGGKATKQALFVKYEAGSVPVAGAYLKMDILAQIVKNRTAWGSVPEGLSNDVESDN